mgnify:CR=1 FL=1
MRHRRLALLLLVSLCGVARSASAEPAYRYYIEGSYARAELETSDGDSPRSIRDVPALDAQFGGAALYAGAVGLTGEQLRLELAYLDTRHDIDPQGAVQAGGDEVAGSGPYLNAWYRFFPERRWHPFVGAGIGYLDLKIGDAKDSKMGLQGGFGVEFDVAKAFTVAVRGQYISAGNTHFRFATDEAFALDYNVFSYALVLRYGFGATAPAPTDEPAAPVEVVPVASEAAPPAAVP